MDQPNLAKKRLSYPATLLGVAMFMVGSQGLAQSAGSFLTSPYVPPVPPASEPKIEAEKAAEPKCACPDPKAVVAPNQAEKPPAKKPSLAPVKEGKPSVVTSRSARPKSTSAANSAGKKGESKSSVAPKKPQAGGASTVGMSPVVMFGPPARMMPTQPDGAAMTTVELEPIVSILPAPIAPMEFPMEARSKISPGRMGILQRLKNVMKPTIPPKKGVKPNPNPSAFARIWRDSKTGLLHDAPEALADALPWVDKSQKAEPISEVLTKVVDDLNRAAAQDPEWVNPAERELRELSKRLSTLSEPPPSVPNPAQLGSDGEIAKGDRPISYGSRPFRPRPIWPGATVSSEVQSRPVSVVTYTGLDNGPAVQGQPLPVVADPAEETASAAKSPPKNAPARRTGRRSR